MEFKIHVHHHGDDATTAAIARLQQQLNSHGALLMAISAAIQAFSERVNVATNEIAKDLRELREKIAAGTGLSEEDLAALDTIATSLEAMGVDPENPV